MSERPIGARLGECAFCGHPEGLHRVVDVIAERILAGEDRDGALADYGWSASEFLAASATVARALMGVGDDSVASRIAAEIAAKAPVDDLDDLLIPGLTEDEVKGFTEALGECDE